MGKVQCECGVAVTDTRLQVHLSGKAHAQAMNSSAQGTDPVESEPIESGPIESGPIEARPADVAAPAAAIPEDLDLRRKLAEERIGMSVGVVDKSLTNDTDYAALEAQRVAQMRAEEAELHGRERAPDNRRAGDITFEKMPFLAQVGQYDAAPIPPTDEALQRASDREIEAITMNTSDELAKMMADTGNTVVAHMGADTDFTRHTSTYEPQTAAEHEAPFRAMMMSSDSIRLDENRGRLEAAIEDIERPQSSFDAEPDDFERVLGAVVKKLSASFDWSINPMTRHRFIYTRYYFEINVILDFFPSTGPLHRQEMENKQKTIARYNTTADRKIGYIPLLVTAELRRDMVERAKAGEILGFLTLGNSANMILKLIDGVPTMVERAAT